LIGLVCSLLTRTQTAAATMLAAAVLGAGLTFYSVENMRQEMRHELSSAQNEQSAPVEDNPFFSVAQQREMAQAMASSVKVEAEQGYYLTLGGLVLAALFSLLTLFGRRPVEAKAPPAPS
jgi:uncharacterized membrane protein YeiB